jgi:cell division protease FtsH
VTKHKNVSDETTQRIDEEVRSIIDRNYKRAKDILVENMEKLHTMADALMKYETIDSDQIDDIMAGKPPRTPQGWSDDDHGSATPAGTRESKWPGEKEGKIGGPAGQH